MKTKKCLIAYFSRPGSNYASGHVVDLPVGNTEVAAKMIQEMTGGDLFRVETVKAYPADYMDTTEIAGKEMREGARPEIAGSVKDIAKYDVVFLGYPNWWDTMPMAMFTFLEKHNLMGLTIAPFCTHEGNGMGRSAGDIAKTCPGARIVEGLAIQGTHVEESWEVIEAWVGKIAGE
jgi:flavodoxin